MIKLAIFAVFLIIGIISAIVRSTSAGIDKFSQKYIIDKIKNNTSEVLKYISNLDLPYDKKTNLTAQDFGIIRDKVKSSFLIGNYVVVYTHIISDHEFVVFTELSYVDYDGGTTSNTGDVNKKAFHNFLFRHDPNQNELSILSDLFSGTTAKFQKQEFIQSLFNVN
jgi:hypothetical protein